jgi:hypothetical protein
MPQPERLPGGPRPPERGTPSPESELPRYHQAARFAREELAATTYFAAQEIVFAHAGDVDLSAYRFQLNRVDQVVVLGDPPLTDLHDQLRAVLAAGEPAVVPEEVLRLLNARRNVATKAGPWVEGHYRPGKRIT